MFHRFTWVHITRLVGLVGLGYEVFIDRIDRPTVMLVLGAMILGGETIGNIFGGRK